jgi:peptidyl-prolyl cis-trans isomerase D
MLRGIHNATSTWLGKVLMAIVMGGLIISFAIWGIGDIFRGFGANSVAKIGGTEISVEQFRQYYSDKLQQLGQRLGRSISPDQARAIGIDRQLLGQLVAETALDELAKDMRLGLADKDIAARIMADPNFKGVNGQFDRARFEAVIRNAGYSEQRYVAEQRNVLLRREIAQTVSGELPVPKTILQAINQYQKEKRAIDYVALTEAQAGEIPAPTPEELAKYFEAHKVTFRAPEYRKLTLLPLSPAELAKPDAVSDADAKAFYESRKDTYGTPEKRDVKQILFPTLEEAQAAKDKIAKGATFADIVKERNLKPTDTDLGLVPKSDIIDPAVAAAAFALKPGDVSDPVKGSFGTVLVTVGKIEPGAQKTYEEVAPEIKKEIAEQRARGDIGNLRDKIEDERAAGSTLAETAQKLNLKAVTIDAVDRSGRAPDGNLVTALPKQPDVVSAAFASDVGVDNDALQMPGNGYLYYDVTGITPARDRTLDEVKDKVAARWRDDEISKRLQAKSDDMIAKLKAGATLAQIATGGGLNIQTAADLERGKAAGFVPAKVVDVVFRTAKGQAAATQGDTETSRFVFVVTGVTEPKFDANAPELEQLSTQMQNSYADDLIGEYIAKVETDIGVSINQSALNQVIGGGPTNN